MKKEFISRISEYLFFRKISLIRFTTMNTNVTTQNFWTLNILDKYPANNYASVYYLIDTSS